MRIRGRSAAWWRSSSPPWLLGHPWGHVHRTEIGARPGVFGVFLLGLGGNGDLLFNTLLLRCWPVAPVRVSKLQNALRPSPLSWSFSTASKSQLSFSNVHLISRLPTLAYCPVPIHFFFPSNIVNPLSPSFLSPMSSHSITNTQISTLQARHAVLSL